MESFRSEIGWKPRVSVAVLKVLSPTRFFVREAPGPQMSQGGREFIIMEAKIKKLLRKRGTNLSSELPPEVGSVVLVNKPKENEWYRALVNKVVDSESGCHVEVTLVDYGEVFLANRNQLCTVPNKRVLKVPFQCIEFSLLGLRPVLPTADQATLTTKQNPDGLWSVAAIDYVNSTLKRATSVQVEVLGETILGGLYGRLLVEWNKSFVPLNEELVNLNYAILDPEAGCDDDILKEQGAQHETGENKHPSIPNLPVQSIAEGPSLCHHNLQKNALAELQEVLDNTSKDFLPNIEQQIPLDSPAEEVLLGASICADAVSSSMQQLRSLTSSLVGLSGSRAMSLEDSVPKDLGRHKAVRCVNGVSASTPTAMSLSPTATFQGSLLTPVSENMLQNLPAFSEPFELPCMTGTDLIKEPPPNGRAQLTQSLSGSTAAILQLEESATFLPVRNSSLDLSVPAPSRSDHYQVLLSGCAGTEQEQQECQPAQSDGDNLELATLQKGASDRCSLQVNGNKLGLTSPQADASDRCSPQVDSDNLGLLSAQAGASDRCSSQLVGKANRLKDLLQPRKHSCSGLLWLNCSFSPASSSTEEASRSGRLEMTASAAYDGTPIGLALDKTKLQAEQAASNSASTKDQAPVKKKSKGPPKLNEYKDFMTPCNVIEEEVDRAAEEAKWNLRFTPEEPDLAAMNVCKAPEDFRCHDFRNFSEVPPNLDPYMQLKDGAHFDGSFDSCKLPSLPAQNSKLRALCHGMRAPKSATTCLDETCFDDSLKDRLCSLGFRGPSCIQSVVWPAISCGRNVVAVAPPHSGKTLAYLIPLISQVLTDSAYQKLRDGVGPWVLVLTSTWKGAQRIYEQVKLLADETRGPTCCALYAAGSESGKEVPIVNGVDILVATPHSFLRYLNNYKRLILNLSRCCHLVLDDGDRLLDKYKTEVMTVVGEFLRGQKKRLPSLQFSQILVCSTTWTSSLRFLLHMPEVFPNPLVMLSSFLEAAVYAQVPTVACYVDPNAHNEVLLAIVKEHRSKKVVVTMAEREMAIAAQQLLHSSDVHCLLIHDELTMAVIREMSTQWTSAHPKDKFPVLVVQDSVLLLADIRDAAILVHYDVPKLSEFNFGLRYSCIADRMRSFRDKGDASHSPEGPMSYLIISRDSGGCSIQLVEFLSRLGSEIPDELRQLAAVEQARISTDAKLALCPNLKLFGHCETQKRCSFRHHILPQADHSPIWSDLPSEGKVCILITKVMSASHFYAWILRHWEAPSRWANEGKPGATENLEPQETVLALSDYLSEPENCKPLEKGAVPMPGQVFGLQCGTDHFQRVLVTSVAPGNHEPASVTVMHMDYGGQSNVAANQLIPLPPRLTQMRPLAVEVYCCGIQPPDGDVSWSFQADFRVHSLFFKKELVGKVALRLGNTLWLDSLVLQKELPFVNATVTMQSVSGTLVQEGFACKNSAHVESLRRMAVDAGASAPLLSVGKKACKDSMSTLVNRCCTTYLDVENYNHVYLWKVVSPAHFYVQPVQFIACLDQLEDDIQKAVEKRTMKKLKRMGIGAPCIARCANSRWYRAEVLEVISDDEVVVFFPDYGDTATCCSDELFESHPSMMMLPYQAVLCSLAGIGCPPHKWSPEAQSVLEDFGYDDKDINQILCLKVVARSAGDRPGSSHYEVLLFNMCDMGRTSAADVLVNRGLAIATGLPVLDFDLNLPHESLLEERDSGLPQSDSDDDGEFLEARKNMEEHMNKVYAIFREQLQNPEPSLELCPGPSSLQYEDPARLPQAKATKKCEEPERRAHKEPGGERSPQEHHQRGKKVAASKKKRSIKAKLEAALKSGMPLLDSQFKTTSNRLAPVSWWQDHCCVHVDVLVENATHYELKVTASVLLLRTATAEQEFLVHERLCHSIVPEQTKLVWKERCVTITLEKAHAKRTWNFLTRPTHKVPHIRYDLNRVMDDEDDDDVFEACKDPDFTAPTRTSVVLPYDPVAHADWNIEIEANEEDICVPTKDVDRCLDSNNIFEGHEL